MLKVVILQKQDRDEKNVSDEDLAKEIKHLLKKGLKDEFFDRFNYEQYGGSPILGVNAPVIIGHGISSPEAIKNMILLSKTMIESKLVDKIKAAFTS